jgi:hypothetical protein
MSLKKRVPDVEVDVETPVQETTSVEETNAPLQVNDSKNENEVNEKTKQDHTSTSKGPSIRVQKNHPQDLIIGNHD